MLQGLLKMWMLKIISEGEVSGYQIIKKVNELTGKKPSTGSVYPLLKSMQNRGWIVGKKLPNKTVYQITDSGKIVVKTHGSMKDDYAQKISGSISLAHDTFKDLHLAFINNSDIINPLFNEISKLLAAGVEPQKIRAIISKAISELRQLEKRS
jgi:DNA-binding PadR family transcriptional regulator